MKLMPGTPAAAGAVVLSLVGSPVAAYQQRTEVSEATSAFVSSRSSSASPSTAERTLPFLGRWGKIAAMVAGALWEARQTGEAVSLVASQIAYGVAASLDAPGAPAPAVADNEMGGVVFFWKGVRREIQIEIDASGAHFVRVRGADGDVSFLDEGLGPVPIDPVNRALRAWAQERARGTPLYPRA